MNTVSTNTLTRRTLLRVVTGGLTAFAFAGTALLTGCGGTSGDTGNTGNSGGTGTTSSTSGATTGGTSSTGGATSGTTTGGATTGGTTTGGSGGGTGSGKIHLVLSNATNTNVNTSNFDSDAVVAPLVNQSIGQSLAVTGTMISRPEARTVSLNVVGNPSLAAGQSHQVLHGSAGEAVLDFTDAKFNVFLSFSGAVVIDSVEGKHFKLHLVDVEMRTGSSASAGSFTLNGTMDVTAP